MPRLRVAVIGLGKMGLLHASILNMMPNVQVVALCDKSSLLLKFVKKLFKESRTVQNVEDLLGLDFDCAYITTPIPAHYPVVRSIYLNKITRNLFVEKTLADNWDKAKALSELAEDSGGVNMVGYMRRFAVTFQKAKNLLDKETLGEISSFYACAYSSDFVDLKRGSKVSGSRGGVLNDLGSHVIDLAFFFFGNFEVTSAKTESYGEGGSEDSAHFTVKQSDLAGRFDVSWCMDNYRMPHFGIEIRGEKGTINVNDDKVELTLNGKSKKWYRHDLSDNVDFMLGLPEFYREDEYFVNSVLSGNKTELNFLTASKVDYIIDQVQKKAM
ncbi:MAG: Gfo/Idh/MocA family oxidoreductase [Candidatus Thermoplasmatota archaeon]|nr:Gfo/Idh/MocA family oxidoreductase [Candidatus Thermoplasmatota archaeon]